MAKREKNTDMLWDMKVMLSECEGIELWVASNIVDLIEDGCTIPFIARYRKERSNNMEADKLRTVVSGYEKLKVVQQKAGNAIKSIAKAGKMTDALDTTIRSACTLDEIEHLYAPFKTGSKSTLAERARKLGLEPAAVSILGKCCNINMQSLVQPGLKGVSTLAEVEQSVQHIVADIIAKDGNTLNKIRELCKSSNVQIESSQKSGSKKKENKNDKDVQKFEQYFDFSSSLKLIKPHQVLALNRGESQKVLTVKVVLPDQIIFRFKDWCKKNWTPDHCTPYIRNFLKICIEDSFNRLIQPLMIRQMRSELGKMAELASIDVFAQNLKKLLLSPPVRGKSILGVDPGFKHGCKLALISPAGHVIDTDVIYIHNKLKQFEANKIKKLLLNYRCDTIAIGNGTACRETESFFSDLIQSGLFQPLNIMYCIVNECGASIYSISEDAQKELPNLDPNIRSAVSIARRLQDPLLELVKIEPKHLGVGMYQHDVSEVNLKSALQSVVEECVSFVGVDLNVCTERLLSKIAGLSVTKSRKIIEWRQKNGVFINREQLLSVKGLGPKSYEQCAGFVRINPETIGLQQGSSVVCEKTNHDMKAGIKRKTTSTKESKSKKRKVDTTSVVNVLDMTWIHPESYDIAERLLSKVDASVNEIGQSVMTTKLDQTIHQYGMEVLADELKVGIPTLTLIIDGLKQPKDFDIRSGFAKPLFRKGVMSINDLRSGDVLTGRVENATHFGAFVDIGVGQNGLIHTSQMPHYVLQNGTPLGPGDKVKVKVMNVDVNRGRIGLQLLEVVN